MPSISVTGKAHAVELLAQKMEALRAITEHIAPGRWQSVREPDEQELKATLVLCLPLREVSAKIRSGPPVDEERDLEINVWAGVLPLQSIPCEPIRDSFCDPSIPLPAGISHYKRTPPQVNVF